MFRGLSARGEVNKLGIVARPIEDTATAGGRTLDDGEYQARLQRKRAMDADGDDTAAAIIAFV